MTTIMNSAWTASQVSIRHSALSPNMQSNPSQHSLPPSTPPNFSPSLPSEVSSSSVTPRDSNACDDERFKKNKQVKKQKGPKIGLWIFKKKKKTLRKKHCRKDSKINWMAHRKQAYWKMIFFFLYEIKCALLPPWWKACIFGQWHRPRIRSPLELQ